MGKKIFILKNEVLAESKMMGPDCIKRLTAAYEDLKQKLGVWTFK